jgi:hypothetical protein
MNNNITLKITKNKLTTNIILFYKEYRLYYIALKNKYTLISIMISDIELTQDIYKKLFNMKEQDLFATTINKELRRQGEYN